MSRPEFDVVWDGRGLLSSVDWPPQRWQPDYTWEPSTPPRKRHRGRMTTRACVHCHRVFDVPARRKFLKQRYCSKRCANTINGGQRHQAASCR